MIDAVKSLFLMLSFVLLQSPPSATSIQGTVVRAGASRPIARARVLIAPVVGAPGDPLATTVAMGTPASAPSSSFNITGSLKGVFVTMTDANGAFAFQNLPPASYRLFVEHDDYLFSDYGLFDSGKSTPLVIPLTPTGSIFGRVVDQYGQPQQLFKVRAAINPDQLLRNPVRETLTDDLGEFRLFGLPPGRYYLGALPPPEGRLVSPETVPGLLGPGESYTIAGGSYISGAAAINAGTVPTSLFTTEVKSSAYTEDPIELEADGIVDAGKLITRRSGRIHVRGQFIDGRTGQVATIVAGGSSAIPLSPQGTAIPAGSTAGSFDFSGLLPGRYLIRGVAPGPLSGEIEIDIRDVDMDNLRVLLLPAVTVRMQVTPPRGPTQIRLTSLRGPTLSLSASVSPDGAVTMPNVLVGDYRLAIATPDGKAYLKSARLEEIDVLANGLRVDDSTRGAVQIGIGFNGGSLDSDVTSRASQPAKGVTVVLVPSGSQAGRVDLYRTAVADADGKAHVDGIAPGEYEVVAAPNVSDGAWLIPDFMRRFGPGQTVHFVEGGTVRISLKVN